jgi:hypothetical protein
MAISFVIYLFSLLFMDNPLTCSTERCGQILAMRVHGPPADAS